MRDVFDMSNDAKPRRTHPTPGLHWTMAKPGALVAIEGRPGAWRILARGGSTALLEHTWSGKRERVPLPLLKLA